MRLLQAHATARPQEPALLTAAEVEAERIVALLRIAVALGLMLAMMLAIDSVRAIEEPHLRRQIGLAAATLLSYLTVGGLIYWAIGKGLFKPWMIWLAVLADCAFLLLNTFLSLVNTGVPGGALFVMPAVWMAPVVLAFGVLRFNPLRLAVMLVLIAAGLGWMILWQPPQTTPDLAGRIALSLAPPPNVMRLVMLCLAGAVLVVAAVRMRHLLHRSIEEARQKANLTRYLPAQLAGRLAGGGLEALQAGRQQPMAILFIDIRGFTSWCEGREPKEVSALITEFRARVEDVAGRTSGLIDKYIGDAAMILFEGEHAAARALDCAEGLLADVTAWCRMREQAGGAGLAAGIGVHWGEVFSGVTGTPERLEYSVFGDTVNTAARLEQLTKVHGMALIASEALLRAAGAEPARNGWTALPAEVLRGRSKQLALFGKAQG
ncbi:MULTISPECIES: adenylate/guanylate cyclase domain-containing protein [Leisingera]|jgi:adenylate cyclase|uniref:adenylate/guanylate cyclase domain-containing protein n=1 Tax=Leisingera TaxID=191028 RepID=UPI0011512106|nr:MULTISPECIES: adenylate/guanylate cyclase domain-containing protein [Leisingera]QDI77382.1 adenylate/guanylate cyclase domain-containing protein [Leisingera aquaemixtae]